MLPLCFFNVVQLYDLQVWGLADCLFVSVCLTGESGLGKSTLINSLFLTDLYSAEYPGPSHRIKKTVQVRGVSRTQVTPSYSRGQGQIWDINLSVTFRGEISATPRSMRDVLSPTQTLNTDHHLQQSSEVPSLPLLTNTLPTHSYFLFEIADSCRTS